MSRNYDLDDRPDRIELADLADRPTRCELDRDDIEPADFDDHRIAERYGPQAGGHFAHEATPVEDYGMGEW